MDACSEGMNVEKPEEQELSHTTIQQGGRKKNEDRKIKKKEITGLQ